MYSDPTPLDFSYRVKQKIYHTPPVDRENLEFMVRRAFNEIISEQLDNVSYGYCKPNILV